MNFYKHYIGDYQRDTGHLSLAEHGAYRLMLDAFYATGKPLPHDKKALYRLLRAATSVERKAIDAVSAQFWETTPAGLINRRAAIEIGKAARQAEINRQIAVEREKRKRQSLADMAALSSGDGDRMEETVGNDSLSDPVHESDKVFEVCRVNNTHNDSTMQPFSCTNRATKVAPSQAREEVDEGGLSREPIQNQNQNHNQNRDDKGCGNLATIRLDGPETDDFENTSTDKKERDEDETFFSREAGKEVVSDEPDDFASADLSSSGDVEPDGSVLAAREVSREMKNRSVSLAKAMRHAGIMAASGDPRLMELARQGVDADTIEAACSEAKRAKPDERIGLTYVVRIVERWARDAKSIAARGARAHGRVCVQEERRKALDELTGRRASQTASSFSGLPLMLDGSVRVIDRDAGEE